MQTSLSEFLQSNASCVPQDFMQCFIDNYTNKQSWISVEQLYDWVNTVSHFQNYCDFVMIVVQTVQISDVIGDFIEYNTQDQHYISQKGVKHIMYSSNETSEYYAVLEQCLLDYLRQTNDQQQQQLQQLQVIRRTYPTESVYRIKNKQTGEILYVGTDTTKEQNKPQQHLTTRQNILAQGYQQIDLILATLKIEDIDIQVSK